MTSQSLKLLYLLGLLIAEGLRFPQRLKHRQHPKQTAILQNHRSRLEIALLSLLLLGVWVLPLIYSVTPWLDRANYLLPGWCSWLGMIIFSLGLWGFTQPLLLQNWLAGCAGLAAIIPLYFLRLPHEEAMLLEQFGTVYQTYMDQTGRIFPRLRSGIK